MTRTLAPSSLNTEGALLAALEQLLMRWPHLPAAYQVLALDQHGHGDSSKALGSYTLDDFTADVVA